MANKQVPQDQQSECGAPDDVRAAGDKQAETPNDVPALDQCKVSFPIVGIGASAGGLEAFEKFFTHMPLDSGMAFVLVQHLSSPHKSILGDLVQRLTRMKVYAVTDGIDVQPNCAYIIPPNKDMALLHGKLHLMEPEAKRGLRLPIDYFFRSLAQDQHERAICIVLSGTGADGTLGLKAIKGKGGMVMAQDMQSAKYDGMPRSAVSTGQVDYVLPPEEMPGQLMAYVEHAFGLEGERIAAPVPETIDSIEKIFILLRAQTGHDFSYYKQNTIRRRIERRMAVNQIGRLDHYVRFLQQNPMEVETLFRELLIGVTNFFRDPEAFESLQTQVIPPLLEGRSSEQPVRIWVAGCSTGEEAYSIAILLREQTDALKRNIKVQIFATDIDGDAIEKARAGVYPDGIVADIAPDRLNKFFSQEGNVYQIKKSIRDMVVFAEQNVIEDPPFSRIDLISCRNLLIYLQPELQKRVLSLFHYSLRSDGVLLLGNSESVGVSADLFAAVDKKWKLYRRRENASIQRPLMGFPRPTFLTDIESAHGVDAVGLEKKTSLRELAETALLQNYTPACVIANEKADVLYIHGRTGKYLEPSPGEASLNILKMAREGVRLELATAIRKVIAQKIPVRYTGLEVKTNGERQTINLTVRPVLEPPGMRGLIMILFEDIGAENRAEAVETTPDPATEDADRIGSRVAGLEQELRAKEQYLQTTVEELETSNEELRSTNEELQSANEELQSTNEELETSKEELQSVNEELVMVNAEHQKKIDELSLANNDMNNLLAATGVGTVYLDHQLCIQRFTPAAAKVINLIQNDIGRPVDHISSNLMDYDHLVADAQQVLDTLIPIETQVETEEGQSYLLRILPYRTLENVIEGAVITFVEVTEMERIRASLHESQSRWRSLTESSPDQIVLLDRDANIEFVNHTVPELTVEQVVGTPIYDYVPEKFRPMMQACFERVLKTGNPDQYETEFMRADGSIDLYEANVGPIAHGDEIASLLVTTRNITGRKKIELLSRLSVVLADSNDAITVQDFAGNITAWNPGAERMYGWSEAEALTMNIRELIPEEKREDALAFVRKLADGMTMELFETQRITKEGEVLDIRLTGTALVNDDGEPYAVATTERDMTVRKP